jgi:CHAT domain-containing protein
LPQQTAASSPPQPAQTESSATTDAAAQIDELMKQCNQQMNVAGQFKRAGELAQQALDLSQKVGDKVRAASAMVYLGAALAYQGRLAEALDVSQKNVILAREAGDKKVLAMALNTAAGVAEESGRSEESLAYLYEELDVAREIGDPIRHYMALLNIGELYVRVGDPDKAEAPLLESLRLGREIKHSETIRNPSKKAVEMAFANLGEMELTRYRYHAALNYYEQVYASRPDSPLWVITALQGMAEAHEQLGEHQKAIDLLGEAIPLAEKASAGLPYAFIVSDLGRSQESLGLLNDALASQNRALAIVHESGGNPDYDWQFESRIGHVDRALGRNNESLEHYQRSIRGIERLRGFAINTEGGRAGALERSHATYAETADLLFDLHRPEEALATAERGRARAFLDILAVSRSIVDDLTPEQHQREDAILARVSTAQKNLWAENITADDKKKNEAALTSAEDDLDGFHVEVRQSNPRYASVHYPEPVRVSEIQDKLLDDSTALVEYLLGTKRSLVWVVTKDGVTTSVLPARKEIEDQVGAYRKLLSKRASALTVHQARAEITRLGTKLYSSLFQPIETVIASRRTLIIVPDGNLHYLPFEALVGGSRGPASRGNRPSYLAEKFAIVYGPSASALVTIQALNHETVIPPKMLLAFGDPVPFSSSPVSHGGSPDQVSEAVSRAGKVSVSEDYAERGFSLARLPYTRAEVLGIGKLFPISQRDVYLGPEAREETLKSEKLDEFHYIHFASHGFLDETRPSRSGILFSRAPDSAESGVLRVDEIMRLKTNADLVTLSACSTGLGKLVNGEGVLGLTRAFFYAGARNVAVSLWNVNDSATATLMASFYRNLNRGQPKAEALRQAKLELIRNPQSTWRHPYFWAAFVIEGEGR